MKNNNNLIPKMEIQMIDPFELIPQGFNPPRRTTKTSSTMKSLTRFILKHGFLFPVIIDEKRNLITGHRRREAAIIIGMDKIPCLVINSKYPVAFMFRMEMTNMSFNGRDALYAYLYREGEGRDAIKPSMLEKIDYLKKILGLSFLRNISEKEINPLSIFDAMRKYSALCKNDTKEFKIKIGEYKLKYPRMTTDTYIIQAMDPKETYKKIVNMIPFEKEWEKILKSTT